MTASDNSNGTDKKILSNVNPYPDEDWDELVDAMHNYLGALRQQANERKEEALEAIEETEEKFAEVEKKRKKRYTYGTRTGIIIKGEGDDSDDDDSDDE
jgi:flagellar biosynthesis/type III secretory pathway chaperone